MEPHFQFLTTKSFQCPLPRASLLFPSLTGIAKRWVRIEIGMSSLCLLAAGAKKTVLREVLWKKVPKGRPHNQFSRGATSSWGSAHYICGGHGILERFLFFHWALRKYLLGGFCAVPRNDTHFVGIWGLPVPCTNFFPKTSDTSAHRDTCQWVLMLTLFLGNPASVPQGLLHDPCACA